MGRTQLTPRRLSETKKTNIGRLIIFCEGKTEKFYFDYFAEIIKKTSIPMLRLCWKLQTAMHRLF